MLGQHRHRLDKQIRMLLQDRRDGLGVLMSLIPYGFIGGTRFTDPLR